MECVGGLLGSAIAGFAAVVDPEAIVIGGGVSKAGQPLRDCIQKHYIRHAFPSCKETPIKLATLGNDAGIYGAAKMVSEKYIFKDLKIFTEEGFQNLESLF